MIDPKTLDVNKALMMAAYRTRVHDGQASQWKASKDYEVIGMFGEWRFALWYNLLMHDTEVFAGGGDPGYDFKTHDNTFTIDVKTYQTPEHLLWKTDTKYEPADILVLLGCTLKKKNGVIWGATVWDEGWAWGADAKSWTTKPFAGVRSHAKHTSQLFRLPSYPRKTLLGDDFLSYCLSDQDEVSM